MDTVIIFSFYCGEQKTTLILKVLNHLVAHEDVDAGGALSVNLANPVEREIEHQRELPSNFRGDHFLQVDGVVNVGCPTAVLASATRSWRLPSQGCAAWLLLAHIDGQTGPD